MEDRAAGCYWRGTEVWCQQRGAVPEGPLMRQQELRIPGSISFRAQILQPLLLLLQTPDNLKTRLGEEAFNDDGLVQRAIRLLKENFPDLEVGLLLLTSSLHTGNVYHWVQEAQAVPLLACQASAARRCTQMWRWTPTT